MEKVCRWCGDLPARCSRDRGGTRHPPRRSLTTRPGMTATQAKLNRVNTTQVRRGRDGKNYPATPLTRPERSRAIRRAHELICRDGLSIRAAQARMAEAGLRRSVGTIAQDLRGFECPHCADANT